MILFSIKQLDENDKSYLKPYLIEVNHMPSFNLDTKVDKAVKEVILSL